tara:strand:+ start:166 stop:495 length:330 start_codon:yes stop_codon:yes gene_type:complete
MMVYKNLYDKLLQIAIDGNYTPAQVRSATKAQVASLLDIDVSDPAWTGGNIGLFKNLRENIAQQLEINIITPKIASIKAAIEAVFPNAEYTVKKRQGIVIVFLNGRDEK